MFVRSVSVHSVCVRSRSSFISHSRRKNFTANCFGCLHFRGSRNAEMHHQTLLLPDPKPALQFTVPQFPALHQQIGEYLSSFFFREKCLCILNFMIFSDDARSPLGKVDDARALSIFSWDPVHCPATFSDLWTSSTMPGHRRRCPCPRRCP